MGEEKYICHGCVGDPYISNEIKKMALLKNGAVTVRAEKKLCRLVSW
jgi:hypothetical protein